MEIKTLFCLKCKKRQEVENAEEVTMKNGGRGLKAQCPVCGTKMFKFLGKPKKIQNDT